MPTQSKESHQSFVASWCNSSEMDQSSECMYVQEGVFEGFDLFLIIYLPEDGDGMSPTICADEK